MLIQNYIKIERPGQLLQKSLPLVPISRNLQILLKKFVTLKIFFLQKGFLVHNDFAVSEFQLDYRATIIRSQATLWPAGLALGSLGL